MRKHTLNSTNKQESKVALITGGARRIGACIVRTMHVAGFRVVIHCHHSLKEAHDLAQSLNQQRMDSAFVIQHDLRDPSFAQDIITTINQWAGRLDVLVNNASLFIRSQTIVLESQAMG